MIIKSKIFLSHSVKANKKSRVIAEIYVDTVAELPAYDYDENFDIIQGSVAYVVQTGELYVMGSDGKWYNSESGTPSTTTEVNEPVSDIEKSDITAEKEVE